MPLLRRDQLQIPFVDLQAQARALRDDYERVMRSIVERGAYTLGPELAEFEREFATHCEARCCIGVSSGTDALKLALVGAGIGSGDEVVVPVNTFFATAEAVSRVGAKPVFVDCLAETALIDPAAAAAAVSPRTRAIVPVHLFGQPADMDPLLALAARHDLAVVEDACQAHGARYRGRRVGGLGRAAAFSFYPAKNLGALGDGGAVVSQDRELAEKVVLLRNHGASDKYHHELVGYCDRLHNLQAGFLVVKLRHLDDWNRARRAAAARYDELLADLPEVTPLCRRDDVEHVYHLYVVETDRRDAVAARLKKEGVETGIHYPVPLHLQPAYAHLDHAAGEFPVAERLAGRVLSLPMYPEITAEQQEHVVDRLASVVAERAPV